MAVYKDMLEHIKDTSTLSDKEIRSVLSKVKDFIKNCVSNKEYFMWKGFITIQYKHTKETNRLLNGEKIKVAAKVKPKVKFSR